jgi:hypothetical protein
MASHPAHLEAALAHLRQSLGKVGSGELHLAEAPWDEMEKGVIKVLGGAFAEAKPEHQAVALGLATLLADRLISAHGAFWFPNRESPEGAMLGFPEALIVLSPYAAVADALSHSNLGQLEATQGQIRQAIGQAKFAPRAASAAPVRLNAGDYARLFDAGFVQLVLLDLEKTKTAWDSPPERLIHDLKDALGRLGEELPAQARAQLESQLVGSLGRLVPGKPVRSQSDGAARLLELLGHLFGAVDGSGSAPEEFWSEVVIPLAFIGAPDRFPPLGDAELAATNEGADLLAMWIDLVPFATPAPEEGLLGAFEPNQITLPTPELGQSGTPRLLQVVPGPLAQALATFDPHAIRTAMGRFAESALKQGGKAPVLAKDSEEMLEAALSLLGDARRLAGALIPGKMAFCVRHLTEAEAASESTWALVRKTLNGPRLILTAR